MNYRPKLNDKGEIQIRPALPGEYFIGTLGRVNPNRTKVTTRDSYMIVEPVGQQPRQEYVFKYLRTGRPISGDYVYSKEDQMWKVLDPRNFSGEYDIYELMSQSPEDATRKLPSKGRKVDVYDEEEEYDD